MNYNSNYNNCEAKHCEKRHGHSKIGNFVRQTVQFFLLYIKEK
jgi:hypothetical protein